MGYFSNGLSRQSGLMSELAQTRPKSEVCVKSVLPPTPDIGRRDRQGRLVRTEELGFSITDALRVYSDDMRHKRLSRAEEKAYNLPAKLALPMMICIFPVLFVVILLPVFVRLHVGNY
jgi:hypothetical protein